MLAPPLHVHLIYHPDSPLAQSLALDLMKDWMPEPTIPDLRVPVFLTPRSAGGKPPVDLPLDAAQHTLVAVLIDEFVADFVRGEGEAWRLWLQKIVGTHPLGSRHQIVPVVLDESGFEVVDRRHAVLAKGDRESQRARVSFALSVRALHLLNKGSDRPANAQGQLEAPIKVFVSHAKKDLAPDNRDPIHWTQNALQNLPVREWFDARDIRWGADFGEEIRNGIHSSDAVLIFLTDGWSSRPWCVSEGLMAKELGVPVLVVNALVAGEERAFPYGGNTRTLRWRSPVVGTQDEEQAAQQAEGERVIAAAVREALRQVHARARLEALGEPHYVILPFAPEAARIAHEPDSATFLYPDPPVSINERELLAKMRPQAEFVTPMSLFAKRRTGSPVQRLAVSISECEDLEDHGLTEDHVRLITDEVYLYLLLAGLQIVYGGKLDPEKLESVEDPDNFTLRLFGLVTRYRDVAKDAGADGLQPIVNAAPWPLWKLYDRSVTKIFGRIAKLEEMQLPTDFPIPQEDLGPLENGFVPPKTPLQLYAWARALTEMREQVTHSTRARLCIGGKIEGYKGRMAGLIEEPLIQMRAKKPLFLVGALGGCTRLVIDCLEDQDPANPRPREEMNSDVAEQKVPLYREVEQLYSVHGGEMPTREALARELRELGSEGPAQALNNGLNDEENRLLFRTTDPATIAELVLTGMERLETQPEPS